MPGEYGFESRPDVWYYLWTGIFPPATDEEIEPDDLCLMKTQIDENRKHDIVLCIIFPTDSKYGSGKYRRLGRQTFKNNINHERFTSLKPPINFSLK